MKKIAKLILEKYISYCYKQGRKPFNREMEKKLMAINPGKSSDVLIYDYYQGKIEKVIKIALVLVLLIVMVFIKTTTEHVVNDNNSIERGSYGEMDKPIKLVAEYDENNYDLDILVKSRKYTEEEIETLYMELSEKLPEIILSAGNNFNLVNSVEGYPFDVRWESRNYDVIHEDGKVFNDISGFQTTDVSLIAYLAYEEYEFEKEIIVTVYPKELSLEDIQKKEIITSILENDNESEQYLLLPSIVGDKEIYFKEVKQPVTTIMAILSFITLVGIWIGTDNDLTKKYKERNRLLSLEYSEFVSKLQLLIGSGMTLRSAFERMGEDYKLSKEKTNRKRFVYEELLYCVRRMGDGISEAECYELFGKRCGLLIYKKLATLLTQNLRKGTKGLLALLNNEIKIAFEERKQTAKKAGEEAQTKLLFPMIIMLGIVMIIIMIPAYVSFGV